MIEHITRRQLIQRAKDLAKIGGIAALIANMPYDMLARALRVKPEYLPMAIQDLALNEAEAANLIGRPYLVPTGGDLRNGATELTTNSGSGGSGSSSAVDNTDASLIKNGGSKNVIVTLTASGANRTHDMRCSLNSIAMTAVPTIGYRFYFNNTFNSNNIDWCSDSGVTTGFRFSTTASPGHGTDRQGWTFFQWHRDEATSTLGAGTWLTTFVRLRNVVNVLDGLTRTFYWDQNFYDGYQRPMVCWIFEGAIDTHYTTAYAKWISKGVQGTLAIPTSSVGSGGFLTVAQIDEMYAMGWDVIHMSDTTTALTGLTVQQVADRLGTADTYMEAQGWTRTPKIIALPGSSFTAHRADANAITALTNAGYRMAIDKWADGGAASCNPTGIDPEYGISLNRYRVPAWRTDNPDTLSEYQFHTRHTIKAGGPRILRSGGLATGAAAGQIETSDHDSLLLELATYHHAGTLSCVPMRKFIGSLSGGFTR